MAGNKIIGIKSVEKKNIFRGYPSAASPDCVGQGMWLSVCKYGATVIFLSMIAGYPKKQKLSANAVKKIPFAFGCLEEAAGDRY